MKKIILSTILFLCISQIGTSQQEPLLKEYIKSYKSSGADTFIVEKEEFYEYDESNKLIFKEILEYTVGGASWHHSGIQYDYNTNQQLKKESFKRYNADVDLWITEDFIEYRYDDDNCLIEEIYIENIGGKIQKRINYNVNENCNWILKEINTNIWPSDTTLYPSHYFERIYFSDGVSYEEKQFDYVTTSDSSFLDNFNTQIFDEEGNIVEQRYTDLNPHHGGYSDTKMVMEYNQFNNRITKERYKRESDTAELDLKYIFYHYNEYDENNFLKKQIQELISHSSDPPSVNPNYSNTISYKNTCEGLLELSERLSESGYREREQFFYEGKNECIDLEKIHLNMRVTPNPSGGVFNIFSPIFQTGDTEILVYSIDGKVLLQKTENSRSTHSNLDLSFLQNGFYILQLKRGDHFVKSKIVIAK